MTDWITPPWDIISAVVFLLLAVVILVRRLRRFKGSMMFQESITHQQKVNREIFGTVIAVAFLCFSIALFFDINWLVWLGLGFIAEEIFQFLLIFVHYLRRDKE